MRYLVLLILLIPTASAIETIVVQDTDEKTSIFPSKQTETYQFVMKEPLLKLGPVDGNLTNETNSTVWKAKIFAQFISDSFEGTQRFTIQYNFNSTNVTLDVLFTKRLITWETTYSFYYNGTLACQTQQNVGLKKFIVFGEAKPPNVWMDFNWALHGVLGTTPTLYISFGSDQRLFGLTPSWDKTCNYGGIGGGIAIAVPELKTNPSVELSSFDETKFYTHNIIHAFDTKKGQLKERDSFLNATEDCALKILFLPCLDPLAVVTFAINSANTFGDTVLGNIPGLGAMYRVIMVPINLILDILIVGLTVFFFTDADEGVKLGQVFWMLCVYFSTWGVIQAAWTGNFLPAVLWPGYFTYYGIFIVVVLTYFIFWATPKTIIEWIIHGLQVVVNAIRG